MNLEFAWDRQKANQNLRKHRVSFEEAKTIFGDPLLLTFHDEWHSETEDRLISIGVSSGSRLLLVVHTERETGKGTQIIRIISARRATAGERKFYEEENPQG